MSGKLAVARASLDPTVGSLEGRHLPPAASICSRAELENAWAVDSRVRSSEFAVAENLDREFETTNGAALIERFGRHRAFDLELDDAIKIDDFPARLVDVGKAALVRQSLLDRQLAAFESRSDAWS